MLFQLPRFTHFALLLLMLIAQPVLAENPFSAAGDLNDNIGLGGGDDILDPEDAFKLRTWTENGRVYAEWDIVEGHYLYRDKIRILPADNSLSTSGFTVDEGELKHDEMFGDVYVFHHQAKASLAVDNAQGGVKGANFKVKYQGCSEIHGICYPPITKDITLDISPFSAAEAATLPATGDSEPVTEQDQIANSLKSGSAVVTILSFFGFGLLLAFTPCIFPMIPILSSIIVGQGETITKGRAFVLSLVYVLAMAAAYTAAGVFAGLGGDNIQAAFQNPWIIGSFAAVFALLSLSMFGFYDLQMPNFIQSRLTEVSNRQQGGTLTGVAIMGLLSALIVGPCVAAPLAGALIYISQTGDAWLGGTALFALSMGMGAPLIAIGTSAGSLLPRAGAWMDAVKAVFGVLMLAVAIWMLERILPAPITMALWATLLIVSAVYMGALETLKAEATGWIKLRKGLGLLLLIYGIILLLGVASGGQQVLKPLGNMLTGTSASSAQTAHLPFKQIKGVDGLNEALAEARAAGKPVMLDFYADWCISCKEMEILTFSKPEVQAALSNAVLLQADVTPNDDEDKALYKKFGIIGPPAIIFYDAEGNEKKNYRVVGYMPADKFNNHVRKALD